MRDSRPLTVTGNAGNFCPTFDDESSTTSGPSPTQKIPVFAPAPLAPATTQRTGPGGNPAGKTILAGCSRGKSGAASVLFAPNQYGGGGTSTGPGSPAVCNCTRGSRTKNCTSGVQSYPPR